MKSSASSPGRTRRRLRRRVPSIASVVLALTLAAGSAPIAVATTVSPSPSPEQTPAAASASTSPQLRAAAQPLKCTAGSVYSVSASGQLFEITDGSRTEVGSKPSKVTSFNGVGIGANGSVAYAYERGGGSAQDIKAIYRYDPGSGQWTQVHGAYSTGLGSSLVAGAVDLKTGDYYFGGFETSGRGQGMVQTFEIWKYSPTADSITKVGSTRTQTGNSTPTSSNGDIAFDSQGNLFIVRGNASTTNVYSITAANLAAATGGNIASSQSASKQTSSDVNGVAFDAAGKAYLGSGSTLTSYGMPNWDSPTNAGSLSGSTDLASCSSPATIMLRKKVDGGRYLDSDQFVLSLKQGNSDLGSAVTDGPADGIQDQVVGPFPTSRGTKIGFSETGADDTDLGNYTSSASCTVDGKSLSADVATSGTSGSVTIPDTGEQVVCTITNTPKNKSTLSVKKNFAARAVSGDQVQLSASVTSSGTTSAVGAPVTTTGSATGVQPQQVGPEKILTGSAHMYTVKETAANGLDFSRYDTTYSCKDTAHSDFSKTGTITTTGSSREVSLGSIAMASDGKARAVECTFTNTPKQAQLTLVKKVDNDYAGTGKPTDWNGKLHAQTGSAAMLNFTTDETKTVKPGEYTLSEDQLDGYEQKSLTCTGATVKDNKVTVNSGDDITCTFVNQDKPGSVTWSKDDGHGHPLAGSEWSLTGPGSEKVTITDCVSSPCAGTDTNPDEGQFMLTGLNWGSYSLAETKAPAGYVLDTTEHKFALTGSKLDFAFDTAFKNDQATPPTLPLTGGTGTDAFMVGGGIVLLAGVGSAVGIWLRRRHNVQS